MAHHDAYTGKETTLVRRLYPRSTKQEIMKVLPGRSWTGIKDHAHRHGIKRNNFAKYNGVERTKRLKLFQKLSSHDLAYFAGILDGEGTITFGRQVGINKTKRWVYWSTLCIVNTSCNLLKWIQNRIPGRIYSKKSLPNGRPCWCLAIGGFWIVKHVLEALMPYLVIKRPQAELLVKGYLHLSDPQREKLFFRLRKLKHNN